MRLWQDVPAFCYFLLALGALIVAPDLEAQVPVDDRVTVFRRLVGRPQVQLHLAGATWINGRFGGLEGEAVTIETPRGPISVATAAVDTIRVLGNAWKTGAIAGALTFFPGLYIVHEFCEYAEGSGCGARMLPGAVLLAVPPFVVGSLIGGAIPKWQQRYPR